MVFLVLQFTLSLWQSGTHQVTATFVTPDQQPLIGIRVKVSLPERDSVLITDAQGRIRFSTWSPQVWFAVAGPGGNRKPYPLPGAQTLAGDQVSLTLVVAPQRIPGLVKL